MRYVSNIPPAVMGTKTGLVKGLSAIYAVKPIQDRGQVAPASERSQDKPEGNASLVSKERRDIAIVERRKICRRTRQQKVLIELRSGLDRRRHDLFGTGPAGHIDEKV